MPIDWPHRCSRIALASSSCNSTCIITTTTHHPPTAIRAPPSHLISHISLLPSPGAPCTKDLVNGRKHSRIHVSEEGGVIRGRMDDGREMEDTRKRSRDEEEGAGESASPTVPLSSLLLFVSLSSFFFLLALACLLATHPLCCTYPPNHSHLPVFCTRSRNHTDHDTLTSTYTSVRACAPRGTSQTQHNNPAWQINQLAYLHLRPSSIYSASHTRWRNKRADHKEAPFILSTVHFLPATNKQILFFH